MYIIFNPIDKWLEALEENKKFYASLLKEKDEKIALVEQLLEEGKLPNDYTVIYNL